MTDQNLANYRWLTSPQAIAKFSWLKTVLPLSPNQFIKLRDEIGVARAGILVAQMELKQRAIEKFPRAQQLFFTEIGLQQSTDMAIATFKATQLKQDYPAVTHVTDLCCGIGGDLMALATYFDTTGVDIDPTIAWIAEHNANVTRTTGTVNLLAIDAGNADLESTDWVHLDPDRRADGQRHTALEGYCPPPSFIDVLLAHNRLGKYGLSIKLAPATQVPEQWHSQMASCQWIQSRGECRQQLVIFSTNSQPRTKQAVGVTSNGTAEWVFSVAHDKLHDCNNVAVANTCQTYIYEPAPAIRAAGLSNSWAHQYQLTAIHRRFSYYTSNEQLSPPGGSRFRVVEEMTFDRKQIKQWLRARHIGQLEIKKQGLPFSPSELRKQLQPYGNNQITLIVLGATRSSQRAIAIMAERE
ncbi:MAG: hypothetical protein HOB73_02010 [Planctomycetaceae bacterium]|nr:hypothetical protein [Planctomycetaceae bacterium]